jgi:hypothetical protein
MNILTQIISNIALLVFTFSIGTGCIIVIGPEDIGPNPPIDIPPPSVPGIPACMTTTQDCDGTLEVIGEDEFGCAITECRPHDLIYCQSDSDCEDPNEVCVLMDPECGLENQSADEECIKTCQAMAPQPEPIEPSLCDDVDCADGYICIVERHQSPVTGEITERAACVEQEEEEEEEEERFCSHDGDCDQDERCAFPGEEGFDEETNCMAAEEGICIPRLL